jgi:Ribonuclease G/E
MEYNIKIDLCSNDLADFIKKLREVKNNAETTRKNIVSDMVDLGKNTIVQSIASDNFKEFETPTHVISSKYRYVGINGQQSIYDEFGTGTYGERMPHALKTEMQELYGLNDYNLGVTIRVNNNNKKALEEGIPNGEKYWTYQYYGTWHYTRGRPAGMHVYKASKEMQSKFKSIAEKRVGEWLSKL